MLPVLILGGIYSGVFTATEAASVSVVYALFVEFVVHRELKIAQLPGIVLDAVQNMGALVLIIMMSLGLNQFMVEKELGQMVLEQINSWGLGPVAFMMAMNVFLIVTGMLMDSISAIVLFTPLLVPAAVALGLDPLHVGVVFIVNMEIGYLAPPIATNLFVASSIFKKPCGYTAAPVKARHSASTCPGYRKSLCRPPACARRRAGSAAAARCLWSRTKPRFGSSPVGFSQPTGINAWRRRMEWMPSTSSGNVETRSGLW
jgi:hypothetical protein